VESEYSGRLELTGVQNSRSQSETGFVFWTSPFPLVDFHLPRFGGAFYWDSSDIRRAVIDLDLTPGGRGKDWYPKLSY